MKTGEFSKILLKTTCMVSTYHKSTTSNNKNIIILQCLPVATYCMNEFKQWSFDAKWKFVEF